MTRKSELLDFTTKNFSCKVNVVELRILNKSNFILGTFDSVKLNEKLI